MAAASVVLRLTHHLIDGRIIIGGEVGAIDFVPDGLIVSANNFLGLFVHRALAQPRAAVGTWQREATGDLDEGLPAVLVSCHHVLQVWL